MTLRNRNYAKIILALMITISTGGWDKCDKGGNSNIPQPQRTKLEQAQRDIATNMDRTASALEAIGEAKRKLAENGTLSPSEELPITRALLDANSIATQINEFGKQLKGFNAGDKKELLRLFDEALGHLSQLNDTGVLKIKNAEAQASFSTLLATARTALAAARAIVATLDATNE